MIETTERVDPTGFGWRLKLGAAAFVLSIVAPLAGVPLVTSLGLSVSAKATASAAILACAELLGIAAIAIMGKSGYAYIKERIGRLFRRIGPPAVVSRGRYRTGLVLIVLSILIGWASPYVGPMLPVLQTESVAIALFGDAMLVVGLFVVGGDFWDKVRALFVYDAPAAELP